MQISQFSETLLRKVMLFGHQTDVSDLDEGSIMLKCRFYRDPNSFISNTP